MSPLSLSLSVLSPGSMVVSGAPSHIFAKCITQGCLFRCVPCCLICASHWVTHQPLGVLHRLLHGFILRPAALCTVRYDCCPLSPSPPTGRALIMPLTVSLTLPPSPCLQDLDDPCSSRMKERQLISKGKNLGFFGTQK